MKAQLFMFSYQIRPFSTSLFPVENVKDFLQSDLLRLQFFASFAAKAPKGPKFCRFCICLIAKLLASLPKRRSSKRGQEKRAFGAKMARFIDKFNVLRWQILPVLLANITCLVCQHNVPSWKSWHGESDFFPCLVPCFVTSNEKSCQVFFLLHDCLFLSNELGEDFPSPSFLVHFLSFSLVL